MKKVIFGFAMLSLVFTTSCKKDDDSNGSDQECQTCEAYEFQGQTFPEIEVCKGDNGNAFVAGQDTMQPYEDYIDGIELLTPCN